MPKVKRVNVLHELRMKLKSGYLKEEPPAYTFMKRYPPLNNDQNIMQRKPKHVNVTALSNLYTRAVEKNSLYADEKVYPAYWRHEPQAFTLAKKQYEHIKAGLSEEEAYKKAVAHVDELENASYSDLKEMVKVMEETHSRLPIAASDEALAQKIQFWKNKLSTTQYSELPLAAMGEIDFIVQTEVLKWNEVERERRMRFT